MTAALPLANRRVVVTRAAEQADELVALLVGLGAEPLVVPLIRIVDPADEGRALETELEHLDQYDWLVVTSANGAGRVARGLEAVRQAGAKAGLGRPDDPPRSGHRTGVAAVGTTTAKALGFAVDLVPERQIAEGLVDSFPVNLGLGSGRVLIAQAETARSNLEAGLIAKGWQVTTVAAYRTEPVQPPVDVRDAALSADAVLFASGSAVIAWLAVFGRSAPVAVVVIGPATAAVARSHGLDVSAVAGDHSVPGLVACLTMYLSGSD